ncbi:hypothetical protein [Mucisphaera sp.]|uniref:hypothetical protein n=1 Tax=Mucisphaera sp. TaxID=2913024 RepID=UPI003D118D62
MSVGFRATFGQTAMFLAMVAGVGLLAWFFATFVGYAVLGAEPQWEPGVAWIQWLTKWWFYLSAGGAVVCFVVSKVVESGEEEDLETRVARKRAEEAEG